MVEIMAVPKAWIVTASPRDAIIILLAAFFALLLVVRTANSRDETRLPCLYIRGGRSLLGALLCGGGSLEDRVGIFHLEQLYSNLG